MAPVQPFDWTASALLLEIIDQISMNHLMFT